MKRKTSKMLPRFISKKTDGTYIIIEKLVRDTTKRIEKDYKRRKSWQWEDLESLKKKKIK